MCATDAPIDDAESTDETEPADDGVERRTVLKSAVAVSAAGGVLGAATGSASGHTTENHIVLEALNDGVQFVIKVSGEIAKGDRAGDLDVVHDGDVAVGEIPETGEETDFRFSGSVTAFETGIDEVAVTVNGKDVDPDDFSDDGLLPNRVTVEARGTEVGYEFEVSGDVDPGRLSDLAYRDDVDGDRVTGMVVPGDVDDYYVSGAIEFLDSDGPLDVTVAFDGREGR